jgi:tetratricopeptide (TPR) repeat protein
MLNSAFSGPAPAARSRLIREQAAAALQAGDSGDAERLLRKHLLDQPVDADALGMLAALKVDQRQIEEATTLLRRAANADPGPKHQIALIRHFQKHVGAGLALKEIKALPPAARLSFDMQATEAAMLGALGEHERQIAIYERLTAANPGNHALWKTLGDSLKTVGRFDEAVAALRRAIEARPTYGEAWWTLSNFKKFRFTDRDLKTMTKALRGKLSDEDALHFHFALGKAYEDRADYPRSFRHYAAGKAIRCKANPPNPAWTTDFVDRATAALTPSLFAHHRGGGCPAPDPIFVVGLHRSGSTLVEQILASHPMIEGTQELTVMQQIWDRLGRIGALSGRGPFEELRQLDGRALASLGAEYIERTRASRFTDRPYFVDKLPANWMNIGLIRLILPNARIIDARRHPMACGFSNFKQNYASGITFSYSQESIGHFYHDYLRFMSHVDAVQPGSVHRILNERLIDDPEGETRALIGFLGLPFDDACLAPHRNTRAVATPSAEQVRRPINRDGVDAWRPYEPWLGPLKTALGDAIQQWDK